MIVGWLDAGDAQKFGKELAAFFAERIPPDPSGKKEKSLAKKRQVIVMMLRQIEQFKRQNKLNFYKKAKFGNAFQWALKDAGYDEVFAAELTKELLLAM